MRTLFVIGIICILFFIGFIVHIEIENRRFVENLASRPEVAEHPHTVSSLVENASSGATPDTDKDVEDQKLQVPDDYDWRTDFPLSHQHADTSQDPWASIFNDENDRSEETSEVWYRIADPYERAEAYRAQLISQFGDRSEIDILAELKPKVWQQIPLTLDEMIRHAEAQMGLWPTDGTRSSIELFKTWKAEGREVNFGYGSVPRAAPKDERFNDIKPFIEQYGRDEGVQRFREAYPEKAAALKQYLLKEAPHHGVSPDEIERLFPNVYEPKWEQVVP